jgi:3',5'-cyclic-AMP phosphodiesterase
MAHLSRSRAPARLWLFAVEESAAQITWARLGPGAVRFELTGDGSLPRRPIDVVCDGGPGSLLVEELPPSHELTLTARGPGVPGGCWRQGFRTLDPLPGQELFRLATVSDLHLGETTFGYFRTITEHPDPPEPHTIRAARAAFEELLKWGAQLVVVKGDITHSSRAAQWEHFRDLITGCPVPVESIGGNHDSGVYGRPKDAARNPGARMVDARSALPELGLQAEARAIDVPGLRVVLADTTVPRHHHGSLRGVEEDLLRWAEEARSPVGMFLHHQLMPLPVPTYWPPGIPAPQSTRFVRRLAAVNPASIVTSGHTHRHRSRIQDGVLVTEVGSPKDFPGTWAGYVVHDGGIRQVVRRVADPDILRWTDHSARAALTLWSRWSPGSLADRCVNHRWPSR